MCVQFLRLPIEQGFALPPQEIVSMAQGRRVRLPDLREVPAAWPLQTVLDAWVHLNALNWSLSYIQTANAALEPRLEELWASQPNAAARCLELEPSEAPREAKRAEALSGYGRAERQRCFVVRFTAQGLVREERSWWGGVVADFDDRCRELAGRLIAAEAKAGEAKRRRLEKSASSASRELQAAKEEIAGHQLRCEELTVRVAELEAAASEKCMELQAVHEERARLADRLGEAEAKGQTAQDEAVKHKEQLQQLEARALTLEAEKAAQLQAAEEERRQLTERLAAADALLSVKAAELEAAKVEVSQRNWERCEQHARSEAGVEAVAAEGDVTGDVSMAEDTFVGSKMDLSTLLENATYKERCRQLELNVGKAEAEISKKTAENQRLLVEAATYRERCSQLERKQRACASAACLQHAPLNAARPPAELRPAAASRARPRHPTSSTWRPFSAAPPGSW